MGKKCGAPANSFSMTKVNKILEKRRFLTKEEALEVLKDSYQELFTAYYDGLEGYNKMIQMLIPDARTRVESALLNAKLTESFINHFPERYYSGKYKRAIFRWEGISMLIKKLDNRGKPSYLPTILSDSITSQRQMSLFSDDAAKEDCILIFGYSKDRYGQLTNPRIILYDNGLKWEAAADEITTKTSASGNMSQDIIVKLKSTGEVKKAE